MREGFAQKGSAPWGVDSMYTSVVVTGMNTPTAMTCSAHRWSHRGRRRGHTSKTAKAAVAEEAQDDGAEKE